MKLSALICCYFPVIISFSVVFVFGNYTRGTITLAWFCIAMSLVLKFVPFWVSSHSITSAKSRQLWCFKSKVFSSSLIIAIQIPCIRPQLLSDLYGVSDADEKEVRIALLHISTFSCFSFEVSTNLWYSNTERILQAVFLITDIICTEPVSEVYSITVCILDQSSCQSSFNTKLGRCA